MTRPERASARALSPPTAASWFGKHGGVWLAVTLAIAVTLPRLWSPEFCLDDTYIHLAYVRSLKLGDGLSYNPHDWATGVTSPLWVLMLAAWPAGVLSTLAIKTLGMALHATAAGFVTLVARALDPTPQPTHELVAGLLWATAPLAVHAANSGMEVSLATCLVLIHTWASLRERYRISALCAFLAAAARPELVVYVALTSCGLCMIRRRWAPAGALLSSALAIGGYAAYCQLVSGYPLPNTYYVKSRPFALEQLRYLFVEVLPEEPVVRSVAAMGGVVYGLWWAAKTRSWLPWLIASAAFATLILISGTRVLYEGVDFAQSRYFVPLLWMLPVLFAYALPYVQPRLALAMTVLVIVMTGVGLMARLELQARQEHGVHRLHVEPARFVTTHLPDTSVLGVEGAGALRYLTPRTLRVIDIVGLNDLTLAHVRGQRFARFCYLRDAGVTHLAYPAPWHERLTQAFELRRLASFTEPAYAQVDPALDWTVIVASVVRPRDDFSRQCAALHAHDSARTP